MLASLRRRLSYANVMATIAAFLALGTGGAYAVTQIDKNSVRSKHIVNGQVRSTDVLDNGLSGRDLAESTFGKVPAAAQADSAQNATALGGKQASEFALANRFHGDRQTVPAGLFSETTLFEGGGFRVWANCFPSDASDIAGNISIQATQNDSAVGGRGTGGASFFAQLSANTGQTIVSTISTAGAEATEHGSYLAESPGGTLSGQVVVREDTANNRCHFLAEGVSG